MRSNALLTRHAARPTVGAIHDFLPRRCGMRDQTTEGQLRRELDSILGRLERHEGAAQNDAGAESSRLVGDMFADAQIMASRTLDALGYERLSRRARELANALERVRDGSYGTCEECGGTIPAARRRALPGVTTCVQCQERGERVRRGPEPTESIVRRPRARPKNGRRDEART
jgi:DnaK suppressor protein